MAGTQSKRFRASFWRHIQGRLIIVLLILLVPTLLIQGYVLHEWFKSGRQAELQSSLQMARSVAKTFDRFILDVVHQELLIGRALTVSHLTDEDRRRFMNENMAEYPEFSNLLWVSPEGVVLISHLGEMNGQSIADTKYFQDVVAGRDWTVSDLMRGMASGQPFIAVARGIRDEQGRLLGIVAASIIADRLKDVLDIDLARGGAHALLDGKGMLVYRHPSINPTWEQRNWLRDYPILGEALQGEPVARTLYALYEGKNRLIGFAPVSSIGWVASAGRNEAIAMEPVYSQLLPEAIFLLAITLAAFGAALLLARFIAASVEQLRNHAMALGSGETRDPVIASGPAELQELADSFNEMAGKLQSREMSLRDQREWLRITLSSIGDAVLTADTAGTVTFLNPTAVSLTGWRLEEAFGQPIQSVFRIINEKTRGPAEDIVERVLREGCIVSLANHTALITRDGREIPIEDSAAPIMGENGEVLGVVLVFHDVSNERKVQAALRESEEQLRMFIEHAPASLAMFDREMRFLSVSRRWVNDYNLGKRELKGLSYYEVLPEIPEYWKEVHRRGLAGEVVRAEADRFDRADGSVQWLRWEVRPWRDAAGCVAGILIFNEDITELKKQEDKLRHLNQILRALSDTNQVAINAEDEAEFSEAVCRIIVEDCGHPMVWIGFGGDDENKTVRPVAQAGFEQGYLENIKITWSDTELGCGPTGVAIRTGIPDVCRNMLTEPRMRPWREEALKRGYAASVALPLRVEAGVLGALTIYSKEPDSFADDEVQLLAELADDLAYGITVLRLRLAHEQSGQRLRESQARLDHALRSAGMGAWHLDIPNDRRWFDEQVCYLLGIDPAAFTGAAAEFFEALHPDDRATVRRALTRTMEQGVPYETEYRAVWPDGSVHYIATRGKLARDEMGRPVRLNGLIWDISERKHMEEELRRSRDELDLRVRERTAELVGANEALRNQAALLDLAHDAIFVRDIDDTVTFWNNGAVEMYGFTKEQALGRVAHELLHTKFAEPMDRIREHVLREGRWTGELRHTSSTGEEIIIDSRWALQRGADGEPLGFLEINRDVTAQKRAEAALILNMARLELVNAELQDFAHVASHDLQEPLRKIQTFCDMAQRRCSTVLDGTGKDYLDRVVNSASRMRQLLQDLLQFSRVAAKLEPLTEVDLDKIVREAADVFEASVQQTGCRIEIADIPAVEADESQMLRLFQNLIGNAVKFRGPESPLIRICGRLDDLGMCEISVKDNGIGFAPEFADIIFKPFQRLHSRSEYDGTGMGLAICRKIAERHGGTIRAESTPGKGSTFIVRLPAKHAGLEKFRSAG
jgi:PAS domain S-box-containing protein